MAIEFNITPGQRIVAEVGMQMPGVAGHTPVKGVDYFTEQEVTEIKQEIEQHIEFIKYVTAQTLPTIGTSGILYVDTVSNKTWYWDANTVGYILASGGDFNDIKIINGGIASG